MDLQLAKSFIDQGIFDGAVIWAGTENDDTIKQVIGVADRTTGRKMALDTVFDVSSVTKPVATATCALLLADRKLLDLDADFTDYLPDFHGKLLEPVSVRALAAHYTGIEQDYPVNATADELMQHIFNSPAIMPPWKEFSYSCACYDMLAIIVERISGMPIAEFARENLFKPLGMNDSAWGYPLESQVPRLFVHKRCVEGDRRVIFDLWARKFQPVAMGNAGLFTTAGDLAKYARMLIRKGRGLFTSDIVEREMFRNFAPEGKKPRSFGWNLDEAMRPSSFSRHFVYHSGSSGQSLWVDYANGKFIIILTNLFGEHDEAIDARLQLANSI